MSEKHTQTAIRLPDSLLARIDKLAVHMSPRDIPNSITRTEVLRKAATLGVEQLEKNLKKRT